MCLRICTGFKEVSFRETHLWEHFGRTDQIALITCLKKLNVSGASLINGCLGSTERGGWSGVGREGWQRVGERLARGWRRVGKGLAKGWQRVGEGLAKGSRISLHPPILEFPRRPFRDTGLWLHGFRRCRCGSCNVFHGDALPDVLFATWVGAL